MAEEVKKVQEATAAAVAPQAPVADAMKAVNHSDDEPVVSAKELLAVGAHYGHQARRWNPEMAPYIYAKKNNAHIIDLNKTAQMIQTAYVALKNIVEKGGKVLIVGTKPIAKEVVANEAVRSGSFYVNNRWLGGTLTNFPTIRKRIDLLNQLLDQYEQTKFEGLSKKDAIVKTKLMEKLNSLLGGVKEMRRSTSDLKAIVIVDTNYEHNAVHEAKLLHIPSFGLVDTNCDPRSVTYPIPMNVDGPEAVALVVGLLADAIVAGKGGVVEHAYAAGSDDKSTMKDIVPAQFSPDELRIIRAKIREDIFAAKRNGKKHRKVSKKKFARRPSAPHKDGGESEVKKPVATAAADPSASEAPAASAEKKEATK